MNAEKISSVQMAFLCLVAPIVVSFAISAFLLRMQPSPYWTPLELRPFGLAALVGFLAGIAGCPCFVVYVLTAVASTIIGGELACHTFWKAPLERPAKSE